jgi:hypothetical protein
MYAQFTKFHHSSGSETSVDPTRPGIQLKAQIITFWKCISRSIVLLLDTYMIKVLICVLVYLFALYNKSRVASPSWMRGVTPNKQLLFQS